MRLLHGEIAHLGGQRELSIDPDEPGEDRRCPYDLVVPASADEPGTTAACRVFMVDPFVPVIVVDIGKIATEELREPFPLFRKVRGSDEEFHEWDFVGVRFTDAGLCASSRTD